MTACFGYLKKERNWGLQKLEGWGWMDTEEHKKGYRPYSVGFGGVYIKYMFLLVLGSTKDLGDCTSSSLGIKQMDGQEISL